jgi:tagaturonate reductase
VLTAKTEWQQILDCASNPHMTVVISNTTEVGIQLHKEDKVTDFPPVSFPGKLLAFLYERYKKFEGAHDKGMVIVPTELIIDNGKKLENIVVELAQLNGLEESFINWLKTANSFCNSLVDRIVPGKPSKEEMEVNEKKVGYQDELYCDSEIFSLWAIEGDEHIKNVLSFCQCDEGVVIQSDINLFRELKLRLLNATHTFNCGLAFLSGFNLTRDAMLDETYAEYVKHLMQKEIAASIPCEINEDLKLDFSNKVFDRFCNPYVNHQWISITAQFTSKMKMRCVPLMKNYFKLFNEVPNHMALGFAAFLLFMKSVKKDDGKFYGEANGNVYAITDDSADYFNKCWESMTPEALVTTVINNEELWGTDLKNINGFEATVLNYLNCMLTDGVINTVLSIEKKVTATV